MLYMFFSLVKKLKILISFSSLFNSLNIKGSEDIISSDSPFKGCHVHCPFYIKTLKIK